MARSAKATDGLKTIPINNVFVGEGNIRRTCGDISGLRNTVADVGLLQPIIVRKSDEGFIVIDGSRRLQALKELNVTGSYYRPRRHHRPRRDGSRFTL